ncbi:hypothetical protein SAMN05192560_0778 [Methylobacillus rhizosphaerae]|uniref:Major capsid protein n=1 Tax=Methylobacillus rhizosphaerae TaxID=551994 RepID=A0A238YT34_9PROT|nr:hypothetical protein [Methylobacillus rhizosphaerae]SNR73753.1 hypothetical protein SAMN05192560_0778 [Methylobacillus rhizosphaerae]
MATLPLKNHSTIVDVAKSFGPDGKVAKVAELLAQSNEVLSFLPYREGNLPTGHKGVVRTGLPTVYLRSFYKGVKVSKSGRATIEDVCAMAEGRSEIDVDLAALNGNANEYRASEAVAFVESINQTWAQQLIYGDSSIEPEGIMGLTPRYNSKSAQAGANIIDAGGTGSDNTSIWLLVLGDETIHGIYPKGSQAGLQHKDLGEIDAEDENGDKYRALAELWKWKFGLHVKDWRYAVRIANVDVSDLIAQSGTQAITAATWINKLMIKAMARIPSMGMGRPVFLASRTVKEMLSVGALDKSQNALSFAAALDQYGHVAPGSVAGQGQGISGGQLLFQGVPVLTVDQILSTEARVV